MLIETTSGIILPGHPDFNFYLHGRLPPNWRETFSQESAFVVRADGVTLEMVTEKEFEEYIEGGEYDERLTQMDDEKEFELYLYG